MFKNTLKLLLACAVTATAPVALADFLGDAKASLELRNFYYNRGFRNEGAAQSKRDEWGQGFILNLQSGFTEGRIGFGVEALGTLGVKLDSSPDRTGSGILAHDSERNVADEYSKLTLTAGVLCWAGGTHRGR